MKLSLFFVLKKIKKMKIYTELLKKRVLREMGEFDPSISPSFHQSMKKKFKKMKTMNLYIIIEREIT